MCALGKEYTFPKSNVKDCSCVCVCVFESAVPHRNTLTQSFKPYGHTHAYISKGTHFSTMHTNVQSAHTYIKQKQSMLIPDYWKCVLVFTTFLLIYADFECVVFKFQALPTHSIYEHYRYHANAVYICTLEFAENAWVYFAYSVFFCT